MGVMRVLGAALVAVMLVPCPARADDNDLALSRFGKAAGPDMNGNIPIGGVVPDNAANIKFRSLASELGVVLAPKLLSPADTIGFGGFQFSFEYSLTEISKNKDYWDAARVVDPNNRLQKRPEDFLPTYGVFVRKGIWLPLPSFELGAGALHLGNSNLWSLQGFAKFALQEGFHDWPLPSLAVRGSAGRIMGSDDIDLTVAGFDISISKAFGVGGTATLHPYAGFNFLWIVPRSEVLDASPWCDAFRPMPTDPNAMHYCPMANNATDLNNNFVFKEQSNILRYRYFVGMKVKFYVLSFIGEWEMTAAGSSSATIDGQPVPDQSSAQQTVAVSILLDF
jgi:hypothetical protein